MVRKRHWIRVILTEIIPWLMRQYIFSHLENQQYRRRLLMASVSEWFLCIPRSRILHSSICLSPKRIRVTLYIPVVSDLFIHHPTIWNYLCYCLQDFVLRIWMIWKYLNPLGRGDCTERRSETGKPSIQKSASLKFTMENQLGKCDLLYAIYRCDCNRCISIQWSGFYFVRWQHESCVRESE